MFIGKLVERARRYLSIAVLGIAAVWLTPSHGLAQTAYPQRLIKLVVPVPPGPVADATFRMVAEKLSERWSQPVIVENKPGAALNLGADTVARSEPDGYTLLATPPNPLVISQHFYPRLPFDPSKFVPVSIVVNAPMVLVVNPKVPANDLPELIAYAKANPGKLTYGSAGAGSTPHLAMLMLLAAGQAQMVHVPYQGLAPALRDVLAGHVDVLIDIVGNVTEHIKAGRLKLIAPMSETRLSEFPDAKTASETLKGVAHTDWFSIVAPPGTPTGVASQISQAIAEILKKPDVVKRLQDLSLKPVGSTPEEMAIFLKRESDKWGGVISAAGIKAE